MRCGGADTRIHSLSCPQKYLECDCRCSLILGGMYQGLASVLVVEYVGLILKGKRGGLLASWQLNLWASTTFHY